VQAVFGSVIEYLLFRLKVKAIEGKLEDGERFVNVC